MPLPPLQVWGAGPGTVQRWVTEGCRTLDDLRRRTDLNEMQRVRSCTYLCACVWGAAGLLAFCWDCSGARDSAEPVLNFTASSGVHLQP